MRNIEIALLPYQKQFIERSDEPLLILCTGISAGKTRAAAVWVLLECLKKRSRWIAGAQTFSALKNVLFREIENLLIAWDIGYKYVSGKEFTLENGSQIFGATNENPNGVLGLTDIDGAVIDEAAYTDEEFYNYIGDRLRGEFIRTPKMRLISSPSNSLASKWFTDLCRRNPQCVIHATSLDNTKTSDEFKESLKQRYGVGTPLYRQQVLGEFIETDTSDALITRDKFSDHAILDKGEYWIGCDIARFGVDRTCIILRNNREIIEKVVLHQADSHTIVHNIERLCFGRKVKGIYLDGTGGYSSGVFDILKLTMNNVYEINFGAKSPDELCSNNRAYIYRQLKDAIEDGFYVDDPDLIDEICAQRLHLSNRGLFQLVPKDEVKSYLGKSPDLSDALALSFYCVVDEEVPKDKLQNYTNILFR